MTRSSISTSTSRLMGDHFDEVLEGFCASRSELSLVAGALALIWGLILALLRQLPGKGFLPVRFLTIAYIDVFRGDPAADHHPADLRRPPLPHLLPEGIRIPALVRQARPFWYGVMALTIVYGAYMAEVYRAGIEAVPGGQMEAARSLGMSHRQAMRHVIVPQAVRKVIRADAERIDLPAEGHDPGQRDRPRRGRSWSAAKSSRRPSTARR